MFKYFMVGSNLILLGLNAISLLNIALKPNNIKYFMVGSNLILLGLNTISLLNIDLLKLQTKNNQNILLDLKQKQETMNEEVNYIYKKSNV
jgi:hypothetical protein